MLGPRSSISTFRPRKQSSLATQPPLMPEPTITASNCISISLGCLFDGIEQRDGLLERGDRLAAWNEFVADPMFVFQVLQQGGDAAPVDLLAVVQVAPAG